MKKIDWTDARLYVRTQGDSYISIGGKPFSRSYFLVDGDKRMLVTWSGRDALAAHEWLNSVAVNEEIDLDDIIESIGAVAGYNYHSEEKDFMQCTEEDGSEPDDHIFIHVRRLKDFYDFYRGTHAKK